MSRGEILLVDDTPENLRVLGDLLRANDYAVRVATGGALALRSVRARLPDLVLLDVRMPGMDGFEACRLIRAEPACAAVPILFLSASDEVGDRVAAFRAGGEDFIAKPFQAEEVLARVGTHLALARTRRELQATVAELESFSFAVAHDLRTPLRTIAGFVRMLDEDHGPRLGPDAREQIATIEAATRRMDRLIADLLALAGLGRRPFAPTRVDLSRLAEEVVDELRRADPARVVAVAIAPGLEAEADPGLVRVVLANLIGNAWKFTGATPGATISLTGEAGAGGAVFVVADNGAGFDPRHAGSLFRPFARLHAASEFPGSGIGLATVRRSVERHGGRVWATAEPGRGARFRFTLAPGAAVDA